MGFEPTISTLGKLHVATTSRPREHHGIQRRHGSVSLSIGDQGRHVKGSSNNLVAL